LRTTGSVPQLGTAAALADGLASALALAEAAAVVVAAAVGADDAVEPGAQALTTIATIARLVTMTPGPRLVRRRVDDPSGLALNM